MCREKAGGQDEMRMLRAMYAEGEERLRQAGIEEAGLDAWYLLEFVTGVDKAHYYMEPDRRMEQSVAQEYEKVVNLRAEHIPLQHITGVQDWMRGICWNLSQVWIRHIIIWSRIAGWNKAWHRNMKKW